MEYCIDCHYFDCTSGTDACRYDGKLIKEKDTCHKCVKDDDIIQIYNLYEFKKRRVKQHG